MKRIQEHQNKKNIQDTLTYQLSQFIEYIEDIEMGMQLSRLGLFNPKLLTYDKLDSVNNRNILLIKTSTWINYQDNIILISQLTFSPLTLSKLSHILIIMAINLITLVLLLILKKIIKFISEIINQ